MPKLEIEFEDPEHYKTFEFLLRVHGRIDCEHLVYKVTEVEQ